MSAFNKRDQYGWMAIFLHWLLFILLAGLVAGGKYSDSLDRTDKIGELIFIHKQIGMAVFALMAFRLLWKLINRPVDSLASSSFIRLAAVLTHWILYALVLAQALGGMMMTQLAGRELAFLGIVLPAFAQPIYDVIAPLAGMFGDSPAGQIRALHYWGGLLIMIFAVLHILGALAHHFLRRDDTLRRMTFRYVPDYVRDDLRNKL